MKDQKKLIVLWLTCGRIDKVCNSEVEAREYENSLRKQGVEVKASEIYPAECAQVNIDYQMDNTTLH